MERELDADFDGVSEHDLEASEAIVKAGRETCGTRDLIIRRLIVFNRAHVRAGITSDTEIMRRFYGRCCRLGYKLSTIVAWVEIIKANHITPSNAERTRQALEYADLHRGVIRLGGQEVFADRREGVGLEDLLALTRKLPGDGAKDRRYRALLALSGVTGNRVKHIFEAPKIKCTKGGVKVLWARRKKQDMMKNMLFYDFTWSAPLEADLVTVIEECEGRRWDLGGSAMGIASRLQQWINKRAKKHGLKRIITSTGRAAMTTTLYRRFEAATLSATMFTALLDHHPDTSLRIYQRTK